MLPTCRHAWARPLITITATDANAIDEKRRATSMASSAATVGSTTAPSRTRPPTQTLMAAKWAIVATRPPNATRPRPPWPLSA